MHTHTHTDEWFRGNPGVRGQDLPKDASQYKLEDLGIEPLTLWPPSYSV